MKYVTVTVSSKGILFQGQFLHCIKQHKGDGGETILSDGFKAAHLLKKRNPEAHKLLSTTVMGFRDIGEDYRKFNKLHKTTFFE